MSQQNEFLATVLKHGANHFAGDAANRLLESAPDSQGALRSDDVSLWKNWLAERVEELSAAVSAQKSDIFTEKVRWAGSLFAARNVSSSNVQRALECLRGVLSHELPEGTRSLADEYLRDAVAAAGDTAGHDEAALTADTPEGKLAASYLLTILEGDRHRAISLILDAAEQGATITDLYVRVLGPALREVGQMWVNDEINIADEHFATATTKTVMTRLRAAVGDQPPNGKTVVAAAVQDNQHDLGLLMVADIFEVHGWRTITLGANVPVVDLAQAVETFDADLLLISAALSGQLPAVRDTIRAVRGREPTRDTKVLVGGPAFAGLADLAIQYGADGHAANAIEALEIGNRLVGL